MLPQKQLLPRSAPSQNLRWQKPNPVHLANHAIQMLAAALNHRAPKYEAPSAVMMFGILRANHNARVAKNQPELAQHAVVTKMIVQPAHHVHIKMKPQPVLRVHAVMMQRQAAPVAMKRQLVHLVSTTTKLQLAHRALAAMT